MKHLLLNRFLVAVSFTMVLCCPASATLAQTGTTVLKKFPVSSGLYGGLLDLAYNPENGWITGIYEDATGWNEQVEAPQFTCSFYLCGKWFGDSAIINTYFPFDTNDNVKGVLGVYDTRSLYLFTKEQHGGGCNFIGPRDNAPKFSLSQASNWIEIRGIADGKAYFYPTPAGSSKSKQYVVKGDVVYVDKTDNGWRHCTYRKDENKPAITGWIKSSALVRLW
jgi:hypothetical protein